MRQQLKKMTELSKLLTEACKQWDSKATMLDNLIDETTNIQNAELHLFHYEINNETPECLRTFVTLEEKDDDYNTLANFSKTAGVEVKNSIIPQAHELLKMMMIACGKTVFKLEFHEFAF